jgi:hypothetical protein
MLDFTDLFKSIGIVKQKSEVCCSKVNLTGSNGNVIM